MLVELAIADAYGAGLEYVKDDFLKANHTMTKYTSHPTHNLKAGRYTDDTQMSIAVAEILATWKNGAPPVNNDHMIHDQFAKSFVDVFKRDWRNGYARGFQKFLNGVKDHHEFLLRIKPTSDKSGAAMRAVPIGMIKSIEQVKRISKIQAKVTHDTVDGIAAAQAASLMSHYFYFDLGDKANLGDFLNSNIDIGDHNWNDTYDERIKSKGWMSVKAAVTAIKRNNSLHKILEDICWMGGDTDTAATIAIGSASHSAQFADNLPEILYWNLENGKYGREFLHKLDNKLAECYPR